jgi:hypothetical protein
LDRYGYRNYGRFAVLRDGDFWMQTLHSSYPPRWRPAGSGLSTPRTG